ncbi:MAG TPA: hypothetical protein VLH37_02800 [Bacteroidales bacterium]|nr:hypothetical protein [Bacteroidales bacterium]
MKIYLGFLLVIFMSLVPTNAFCQDACKVLMEAISVTYLGDCRNGLAHGQGIATGIDRYEGSFRRGLPHGRGTYTWDNGDMYNGQWRNGKRHGEGTFIFFQNGEIRKQSGVWIHDIFRGEDTFAAYSRGHIFNLERFAVRKTGEGNRVLVNFYYSGTQGQFPSDFDFKIGTGFSHREGLAKGFDQVDFPAQILITYSVPDKLGRGLSIPVRFELTIYQPGQWEIRLYN